MSQIKFVLKTPDARLPTQESGSVGFDMYAACSCVLPPRSTTIISTGLILADEPQVGGACIHGNLRSLLKIEGRSSLAAKGIWPVGGIIDPSYRGELGVIMYNSRDDAYDINLHDKIAQLVWYPVVANWHEYGRRIEIMAVESVTHTTRGAGGYGSTGV